MRVISSGLDLFLSIPQLNVDVTFGATGFSINLPFQHFGNNTQGHCGKSATPYFCVDGDNTMWMIYEGFVFVHYPSKLLQIILTKERATTTEQMTACFLVGSWWTTVQ